MRRMAMPLETRLASRRRDSCAITDPRNERRTIGSSRASAIPISSNHTRPRPGRRRSLPTTIHTLHLVFCSLIILSSLCVPVSATRSYSGRPRPRYGKLAGRLPRFESIEPDLDHFQPGDIVYDRRFPAAPVHYDIYKRQDAVNVDQSSKGGGAASTAQKHLRFSSTSTARPAAATTEAAFTTASLPASKSTSSQSGEPTLLVTAPGTESSSLPRPFDTGLGNNYTHPNCPVFMNNFLRNETFVSCVPFSLLLQNSMSFFSSTKSLPAITRTLDATCAVRDPNACNTHLSSIASQLRQDSNCGSDYRRQQPLVLAAYNGLVSYSPLFRAGCERDPESGNYCFANAIQNKTSPSDSYPYYLPLGIPLPGGSQPTCSDCLRRTMDIFHESVQERGQQGPLMTNYAGAAQLVNVGCGPSFSNQTVAASAGQSSFAAPTLALPSSSVKLLAFVLLASAGVWL